MGSESEDPNLPKGHCAPGFEAVRDAFAANFRERGEIGAACAVHVEGIAVVDLWAGYRDARRTDPWREDTLVGFFSVGKPLVALALLRLVEAGALQLDAPVMRWWPEFAANGKGGVSVRQLLCHRAGLPAVRERLPEGAMLEWETMTCALAAQEPWWEPGTRHVYHTNTYGFLVGELVRRITGTSPGRYLREKVAAPLGADLAVGLPERDLGRVAELDWEAAAATPDLSFLDEPMSDEQRMIWHGWLNPSGLSGMGVCNTRAWRLAEIPSTNGHGTARGVARVYSALAQGGELEGVRVLGPELLAEASRPQSVGPCPVLRREACFGLGFQCSTAAWPLGLGARSFGHMGTGCSLGFADPDTRVGFGYVMNRIIPRKRSARCDALLEALRTCL